MKRTLALAAALILPALAAFGAEPTHHYVVGTRPNYDHSALARNALDSASAAPLAERNFRDFRYIDSFAADLTEREAAALRLQPGVRFVEQEVPVHAFDMPRARAAFKAAPAYRDPAIQTTPYGITLVHAPDTWVGARGEGVNVAIIDTGIDYNHPDLKDQYAGGFNEVKQTTDPLDDNGHGTHVAGTIAAKDNNIGVVGVAPQARLWSVKVLDANGNGSSTNIAAGIDWVIAKKAELGGDWVINMSLGICSDPSNSNCASSPPLTMSNACQKAADAGVLVFAASGNDSSAGSPKPVGYPAAFSSVIAVGAVDATRTIASFSDQGPELDIVAPGVNVLSTFPVGTASNAFIQKESTIYSADVILGSRPAAVTRQFVYCGIGQNASDFPPSVAGNIALIQRGTVTFNQKTKNAVAAGALGVVIYNCSVTASPATCGNDDMSAGWTLIGKVDANGNPNSGCSDPANPVYSGCVDDPADLAYSWPVTLRLGRDDGEALRNDAAATITASNVPDDYETLSGTSMATPHAAGLAALIWSAAPAARAADVRQAILSTAHDLGAPGQDNAYGFGLVDALAAAKVLAPSKFGSGGTPAPGPITGRRILRRGQG